MNKVATLLVAAAASTLLTGCWSSHKVELSTPQDKPIHIVVDVNIKMDEELRKAFAEEDKKSAQISKDQAEKALEEYLNATNK